MRDRSAPRDCRSNAKRLAWRPAPDQPLSRNLANTRPIYFGAPVSDLFSLDESDLLSLLSLSLLWPSAFDDLSLLLSDFVSVELLE